MMNKELMKELLDSADAIAYIDENKYCKDPWYYLKEYKIDLISNIVVLSNDSSVHEFPIKDYGTTWSLLFSKKPKYIIDENCEVVGEEPAIQSKDLNISTLVAICPQCHNEIRLPIVISKEHNIIGRFCYCCGRELIYKNE